MVHFTNAFVWGVLKGRLAYHGISEDDFIAKCGYANANDGLKQGIGNISHQFLVTCCEIFRIQSRRSKFAILEQQTYEELVELLRLDNKVQAKQQFLL